MVVKVKVRTNSDEVNLAKHKNEFYANKRKENETLPEEQKTEVPDDVVIPDDVIVVSERLWDINDISEAYINDFFPDMITVNHKGIEKMIIYSDEVWQKLKHRFE